jgi:hypothetical protein
MTNEDSREPRVMEPGQRALDLLRDADRMLDPGFSPVAGTITLTSANGSWRTYDLPSGEMTKKYDQLVLPETPGTVIAIGEWWFVKLRPYTEGVEAAWELLPAPKNVAERIERLGIRTQHVYNNEWVLGEADQEGKFKIISEPKETR